MKRTISCILLICCILLSFPSFASADWSRDTEFANSLASSLKAMGLFRGVNDTDFDLNRAPTRAEALVMLLRLMGLEQDALTEKNNHPFLDTDDCHWAEPYIGYAYSHDLLKGQSDTVFGGNDIADVNTYLTFVLRALGYSEGKNQDFLWSSPMGLAQSVGILPKELHTNNFLRADVVLVSYAALAAKCKGSSLSLADSLTTRGAISSDQLSTYYDPSALTMQALQEPYAQNVKRYMHQFHPEDGIDISGLPIKNYSTLMRIGDAAYELYGFYASGAERNAAQIRAAADTLNGKARVFGIVVPNRLGAVLSYSDFSRLCSSSKNETEAIAYAYEKMGPNVHTVDAMSALRLHNDEEIFFRTDHHWTALGAYYAYTAWAESAGVQPVSLENYSSFEMPGHLGIFYGMCGNPSEMKNNPDTVITYNPGGNIRVEVQESNIAYAGQLLYDYTNSSSKYSAFLGGDHPLTTITNDDIKDDSACVLVKDSYGNPFAIYLTQHYHTVYVVDYRYYKNLSGYLTFSQFAEQKGVSDFIVLLPMTLSQSDTTAGYLAKYCK